MAITVEVRHGNVEKAMRVLKKKVLKAGILKEYRLKPVSYTHLTLPTICSV